MKGGLTVQSLINRIDIATMSTGSFIALCVFLAVAKIMSGVLWFLVAE